MSLLKKLVLRFLQAWGAFICILSMGYFFDVHLLENPEEVQLTLSYFLFLFLKGIPLSIIFVILILLVGNKKDG